MATTLRSIQVVLDHQGTQRFVCKIGFSNRDSSFYVIPANVGGTYYYGRHQLGRDEITGTVVYTQGFADDQLPKLSIHESGQVHVGAGERRAGPLHLPPLTTLRGQHVATVTADDITALPARELPSTSPREPDKVIPTDGVVGGVGVVIYVNGREHAYADHCPLLVHLLDPVRQVPLFIGVRLRSQVGLNGGQRVGGINVIGGWDPTTQDAAEPVDFLLLRGDPPAAPTVPEEVGAAAAGGGHSSQAGG